MNKLVDLLRKYCTIAASIFIGLVYCISWTHEHNVCFSDTDDLSHIHCQYAEYYSYLMQELPTATGYRRDIFLAIDKLYDDLNKSRESMVYVIGDELTKGHDQYLEPDGKMYMNIYPISFRLGCHTYI